MSSNWCAKAGRVCESGRCVGDTSVAICLSKELLESELFGHEQGAFTGANKMKKGKIELANGGTIFFDEIGDISGEIQAKLLRFLQEREFERVGGVTLNISVDVRVIAATNRDLAAAVKDGSFSDDLYHRLNVVAITPPPLRERKEDIPTLAEHFLSKFATRSRRNVGQNQRRSMGKNDGLTNGRAMSENLRTRSSMPWC